jgi:hypothetical protein
MMASGSSVLLITLITLVDLVYVCAKPIRAIWQGCRVKQSH